tara:strand:+ start:169 stop:1101 length:933 start_codon:yes stop_codon:yes gene_type:complete
MNTSSSKPQVSIGMPVYNTDEKFLYTALDCLLKQSYSNFELIISDDCSTDSTSRICREYAKKDSRINYIRQEKNMGALPNFNFVLEQAKSKYFMWAEVDDKWKPDFIEKNVSILESNPKFVGSISEVSWYGKNVIRGKGSALKNLLKFRKTYDIFANYFHVLPTSGTYEKKSSLYLRFNRGTSIFAVYRTEKLQKCTVQKPLAGWDLVIILKALRFGDINVLNENLMERYAGGASDKSLLFSQRKEHGGLLASLFLYMPLTIWCLKNLGGKIFFKNIDWFFVLNAYGASMVLPEIPQLIKYVFFRQKPKE